MICYVLAMGKQHLGPHMVVGYGIKIFWPGLFITSPDHLAAHTQKIGSGQSSHSLPQARRTVDSGNENEWSLEIS